ncbi:MAG: hypothetical protein ACRDEA_19485 [Microcystaceae cyanobacterium]
MQITIEIPEEIGNQLQQNWQDLPLEFVRSTFGLKPCRRRLLKAEGNWTLDW